MESLQKLHLFVETLRTHDVNDIGCQTLLSLERQITADKFHHPRFQTFTHLLIHMNSVQTAIIAARHGVTDHET